MADITTGRGDLPGAYDDCLSLGERCTGALLHGEALGHYQRALALRPDAEEPVRRISATLVSAATESLQRGELRGAVTLLQNAFALDLSPHLYQRLWAAYAECAEALLANGSVDAAVDLLRALLLADPDQPRVRLRLEEVLRSRRAAAGGKERHSGGKGKTVLFIPSPVTSGTILLGQILTEILCRDYGFSDLTYHSVRDKRPLMNYPLSEFDYLRALGENRGDAFLCQHYFYREEIARYLKDESFKIVMMKRDPRDALVSALNLFYHNDEANNLSRNRSRYASFEEYVNAHLQEGARWYVEYYKSWAAVPNLYFISFEEIKTNGFLCIKRLLEHAGVDVPNNLIYRALYLTDFRTITKRNPGVEVKNPAGFMRSGVSGEWRTFFNFRQRHLLKLEMAQLLIDLGYETDVLW